MLELAGNRDRLGARHLERWLVGQGFARRNGGPRLLVPTELGLEVGASIAVLDGSGVSSSG